MRKIIRACLKCGKEAKIDKKKSTPQWKVYELELNCSCGGTYGFKQILS